MNIFETSFQTTFYKLSHQNFLHRMVHIFCLVWLWFFTSWFTHGQQHYKNHKNVEILC